MARAETIESVGGTGGGGGGGGNGPLPCHSTCCMELPRPFQTWPSLLTTTTTTTITTGSRTGAGGIRLPLNHHYLHPPSPLCLSYPPPDEMLTRQQLPALSPSSTPPSLLRCIGREERGGGAVRPSAFSGEESDSDREVRPEAPRRRGPLPDLLPQNERPSWTSPRHRAPAREAVQQLEVRRLAGQLRAIGDEFNATVLHGAPAALNWQDWRDACQGLLNFITQTLSALYRLT